MIFVVLVLLLAIVGYWIHIDTKYQAHRRRWDRHQANLAIYRERSSDIAESLDEDSKEQELEASLLLLEDVGNEHETPKQLRATPWLPLATIILICVLALSGYFYWGDPLAVRLESVHSQIQKAYENASEEDLDKVIMLLEKRNDSRLRGVSSSAYLTRLYFDKGDYENVVRTHKLAEQQGTNSLNSDILRVRAAFNIDNQELTEETLAVIQRILVQDPENPTVMQLLAIHSYSLNQFGEARGFLERVLRQPLPPSASELFDRLLSSTNEKLDADHIGVRVTVEVTNLAAPHQWLTVFAREDDNSPPIAVVRRPNITNGIYTFLLDDIVSMIPERKLSSFDRVNVVAQLSPNADVGDSDQTSEIQSGWITPSNRASVSLRLSDVGNEESITVSVALEPSFEAQDDWPVFIIGRRIGESGPPLLVKRVEVRDLPITLTLSASDAMLPGAEFPQEAIEVLARVSSTGSATRAIDDIESNPVHVNVGQRVGLKLNQLVTEAEGQ
ncbi:MAG: c-type cytochrome biogenesis protein CcmI [Gammaproteobacteria bacterium]|nr:c-type cytochrome biogenesis protein CcmI [Gammaproteobacteria bacterium]